MEQSTTAPTSPAPRKRRRTGRHHPVKSGDPLTPKQRQTLDAIHEHIAEHQQSPTLRELMRRFGLSSSCTMERRLSYLRQKGYVTWDRYRPRSLRLVGNDPRDLRQSVFDSAVRVADGQATVEELTAAVRLWREG